MRGFGARAPEPGRCHGPGRQRRAARGRRRGLPPAWGESPPRRRGPRPGAPGCLIAGPRTVAAGSRSWRGRRVEGVAPFPGGSRRREAAPRHSRPLARLRPRLARQPSQCQLCRKRQRFLAGSGRPGMALFPGEDCTRSSRDAFGHLGHVYDRMLCAALCAGHAERTGNSEAPEVLALGSRGSG